MKRHIRYQFQTTQQASRFYTALRSGYCETIEPLDVRQHPDNFCVEASYEDNPSGFDVTAASMDELAETHAGWEIPIS